MQPVYIGQASTTSSGIERAASGHTATDFTTLGNTYKERFQYDNCLKTLNLYANSVDVPTLTIDGTSLTVNTINANSMNSDLLYSQSSDGTRFVGFVR